MVDREPENLRTRGALGYIVLLVSGHTCHCKALCITYRCLSFAIYYIIYGPLVVSVEQTYIENILSEECLL